MFRFLIFLIFYIGLVSTVSAGGGGIGSMPYPSDDGNTVYSEDGTHTGKVICGGDGCSFYLDGIKKVAYQYIDYPLVSGSDFYVTATDMASKRFLIKNGIIIASGEAVNILLGYYNMTSGSQIEGWTLMNDGKYSVYKKDGSLYFQADNAGSASSSYYIADKVLQSTVYNRNNIAMTTYINDKKISHDADGGYVQTYGIYKKSKNVSELLLSSSDSMGMLELMFYNINTGEIRTLPSYDGITQVIPILNRNGTIRDFQYVVTIDEGYAFADMNGNILSKDHYDNVSVFTTYGDTYLKTFTKNEKMYMFYAGKLYGPYDFIDNFTPSYGSQTNYSKVLRWSVFVKNNGKNYILVNGKQFLID